MTAANPFLYLNKRTPFKTIVITFFVVLVTMIVFEFAKEALTGPLTPWYSHLVTVLFVALLASLASYIVLERQESLYRRARDQSDERMETQERLALLAHTLRCITEGVSITDMDDNIIFVNDAFSRMYGYSRDEILDKSISVVRSSRNAPERTRNILPATIAGGWNGELWNRRKNGSDFPVYLSTSVVRNENNEPIALVGVSADITDRKRTETAIIQSEERYRRLVELSPEAIMVHTDGRIVYANAAAINLFGARTDKDLIGKPVLDLVHPDFRALVSNRIHDISFEGKRVPLIEERFIRLDGSAFDVEVAAIPFTFQKRPSVQAVVRDISQRKRAEEALRESEARYRFLAENANDVIWTMDANGKLTYVSPSVQKMRGYSPREVLDQSLEQLFTPASLKLVQARMSEAFDRIRNGDSDLVPMVVEIEQPCRDGSTVWAEVVVNTLFNSSRQFECFLGIARNISERKRAEHALRESEERFRNLAENTEDVFWMVSVDYTKVIYVNPSYERIWGSSVQSLLKNPMEWIEAVHPDDVPRVRKAVEQQIKHESDFEADYRVVRPDGAIHWLQDQGFPIRDDRGEVVAFAGVARDITERKQAEEALVQAQKMESLGILAGGIAHDFNNLLQAMLGQTYLALKKLHPESTARENIEKAQKAAVRASDLTQQMLAYSGRGKFNVRVIDLNTIIRENVHLLEAGIPKTVQLNLELSHPSVHIEADVTQMQQIVMNLVINAAEAMDGRPGTIAVRTSTKAISQKEAGAWQVGESDFTQGEYVILEVSDNGSGMSGETIKRIFDPFFTTKFTGRGLGLAAVLGIVRGHKGGLQVHSESGTGTTFKIAFPTAYDERKDRKPLDTVHSTLRFGGTILLIDDEAAVREVFVDALSEHGISILTASSGDEGIELYKSRANEIALIVLDFSMPGMGGEETFRELKKLNPAVKVVLSSGFAEEEATNRFAGSGLAGFIHKPYHWETLLQNLQSVIKIS